MSDNANQSLDGQQSIDGLISVAVTVHSNDTVKVSNREFKKHGRIQPEPVETKQSSPSLISVEKEPRDSKKPKGGWLQRLVGGKHTFPPPRPNIFPKSSDVDSTRTYPLRDRVMSAENARDKTPTAARGRSASSVTGDSVSNRNKVQLDMAIKGRLDGLDVLSLGPAGRSLLPSRRTEFQSTPKSPKRAAPSSVSASASTSASTESSSTESSASESPIEKDQETKDVEMPDQAQINPQIYLDPLNLRYTELPTSYTTAEMVLDMVRISAGRDHPELILEGFIPGGGDRLCVRIEDDGPEARSVSPDLCTDDDESTAMLTDDGSTSMPSHKLWDHIWGDNPPPPLPSHMQTGSTVNDEDVLQLAAACSVPIDLDEDTFLIDGPEHFRSVLDLAVIPLQVSHTIAEHVGKLGCFGSFSLLKQCICACMIVRHPLIFSAATVR